MATELTPQKKRKSESYGSPTTPQTPKLVQESKLDRETNFKRNEEFINDLTKEELCTLVGELTLEKLGNVNMSRLGKEEKEDLIAKKSKGMKKKPDTFKVEINPSLEIDQSFKIAAKIMEDTEKSRNEISWYIHFLNKNHPNFPRTYAAIQCDVCSKSEVVKENCIVLLSELADGDLQSLVKKMNDGQIESMITQVLNALLVLEEEVIEREDGVFVEGVIHGDLNLGNILCYKENGQWNWRLWDFEMMRRTDQVSLLDDELKTEVNNTFVFDWKTTFLPKLKQYFPRSRFVENVSQITNSSKSIAEVISKLYKID